MDDDKDQPHTISWPRAILTTAIIVVVGIGVLVYGSNAVLTKIHGKTRSSLVAIVTPAVLHHLARVGVDAATTPAPEDHLMAVPAAPERRLALGQRTVPGRVPGTHRRRRLRHGDRRGPLRGRVPHRTRAESVPVGMRTRLCRAVRASLPARFRRRAGFDPGAQAIRDRTFRGRELRREHHVARSARRGTRGERPECRSDRWRTRRARRRVRPAPRRSSRDGLRGAGPARRHDGARHSRVPTAPRAHRSGDRGDHRARHRRRDERAHRRDALDRRAARPPRRAVPRRRYRDRRAISTFPATISTAFCARSSTCST